MKTFECKNCGNQLKRPSAPLRCDKCGQARIGLFKVAGQTTSPGAPAPASLPRPPGAGSPIAPPPPPPGGAAPAAPTPSIPPAATPVAPTAPVQPAAPVPPAAPAPPQAATPAPAAAPDIAATPPPPATTITPPPPAAVQPVSPAPPTPEPPTPEPVLAEPVTPDVPATPAPPVDPQPAAVEPVVNEETPPPDTTPAPVEPVPAEPAPPEPAPVVAETPPASPTEASPAEPEPEAVEATAQLQPAESLPAAEDTPDIARSTVAPGDTVPVERTPAPSEPLASPAQEAEPIAEEVPPEPVNTNMFPPSVLPPTTLPQPSSTPPVPAAPEPPAPVETPSAATPPEPPIPSEPVAEPPAPTPPPASTAIDLPPPSAKKISPGEVVWRYPKLLPGQGQARSALRNCVASDADGNIYAALAEGLACIVEEDNEPQLQWQYETGAPAPGAPVIGNDGRIRLHTTDGKLHCVGADGEASHEPAEIGEPLGWASPVVDSRGNTFISAYKGGLIRVDSSGQTSKRPHFRSRQKFDSTGLLHEDTLYIGSEDAFVYAIDIDGTRGSNLWDHLADKGKTGWFINSSPALTPSNELIVAGRDEYLYAFRLDGDENWKLHIRGQMLASPVVDKHGNIYVGVSLVKRGEDSIGKLICINAKERKVDWEFRARGPVESTPVIGNDGVIYFADNSGHLHAVTLAGEPVWSQSVGSPVRSSLAITSPGRLTMGGDGGLLVSVACSSQSTYEGGWPKYMGAPSNCHPARSH